MFRFPARTIKEILAKAPEQQQQQLPHAAAASAPSVVNGWVRSVRMQKNVAFVEVFDGSCAASLQAVVDPHVFKHVKSLHAGASVKLEGSLVKSIGANQKSELNVTSLTILGPSNPTTYPLHKAKIPLEHLRDNLHLRSRSRTFGAVWRIRNAVVNHIHDFFQSHQFIQVHTPIITSNDCEGAGEVFRVMTGETIKHLSEPKPAQSQDSTSPASTPSNNIPEFFNKPAYLTVSGQLHLELMAAAMPRVYTLSPAFRAEKSVSTRHLAEFYMLEAEVSFITSLDDLMSLIEATVKHVVSKTLDSNMEDIQQLGPLIQSRLKNQHDSIVKTTTATATKTKTKTIESTTSTQTAESTTSTKTAESTTSMKLSSPMNAHIDTLKSLLLPFARATYDEAIHILQCSGKKWEHPIEWGLDLKTEHERYLAEVHFQGPVFITKYPSALKPFYMKESTDYASIDGSTVDCVDLLVPGIGELVGGSLREDRDHVLKRRIKESGLDPVGLDWYMDLRRYGSVPHGGFGLGLERLLVLICGAQTVRDVVSVPRWVDHCQH